DTPLAIVVLLVLRDGEALLAPDDDLALAPGDELLLTGLAPARRSLEATLLLDAVRSYVQTGQRVASGWLWRRLFG
ncbi:MAG TPA: hypothetical protein VEZ42_15430, partial [Pseudonocardia sp.]|nr:hypothetical protein [Pseudonocardia sp.]